MASNFIIPSPYVDLSKIDLPPNGSLSITADVNGNKWLAQLYTVKNPMGGGPLTMVYIGSTDSILNEKVNIIIPLPVFAWIVEEFLPSYKKFADQDELVAAASEMVADAAKNIGGQITEREKEVVAAGALAMLAILEQAGDIKLGR